MVADPKNTKHRKLKIEELERLTIPEFRVAEKIPIIVVLDDVRSLNNIGSVFRTADAFRIQKVYLCGITAKPPHREIQKTALGATESVDWEYAADLIELMDREDSNVHWIALEQAEGSIAIQDFQPKPRERYALIFGNEIKGVRQDVLDQCDTVIEIPQYGTKHSLNIAVSAGITLWYFSIKTAIK